jgi:hypothetical protein
VTTRSDRLSFGVLLLALLCAFSFGAIVRAAMADPSYHVNCVGHGFIEGGSQTDGSFFSRVDDGCNSPNRTCGIYSYNAYRGSATAYGNAICQAWSRTFGDYTECAGTAYTYSANVFSAHFHYAPNRCI